LSVGRILLAVALVCGGAACRRGAEATYAQRLESGQKFLEQGKFAEASIEFRAATRQSPQAAEAYYRLGLSYLAAGNLMEAVPALVRASELNPKHSPSQLKLAELLSSSRDPNLLAEARKRAQEVLAAESRDGDALAVLALTESRIGDIGSAERHLMQALKESPANLKASAILAKLKLAQGDFAGAEQSLRAAVSQSPGSSDSRLLLAELYLAAGRLPEAEEQLRAVLTRDKRNVRAMLALAAMYAMAGRQEEVGQIYRQVSRLGGARYRHLYGAYLFSQGKREDALAEFQAAVREAPADRDARSRLVAALLILDRPQEARRILDSALARNPRDIDALLLQSEIDLRSADHASAIGRLREVLRYKPDSAPAHFLLAKSYSLRGDSRLQREELSQTLNLRPDSQEARLMLARSFMESGNPQAALNTLDQAPPSQREALEYVVLRNHTLLSLGRLEECAAGVSQGLARGPAPDLLVQDGELKLIGKKYGPALAAFDAALRQNPGHLGALGGVFRAVAAERGVPAGLEALRKRAAAQPRSARVQQFLGDRMLANGRREEARKAFQNALSADGRFFEAELSLARLDLVEGNLDSARQRISRAAQAGANPVVVHLLLATVETEGGKTDAAAAHYRKVLEIDSSNTAALNNLAYLLAEYGGRLDEALNLVQKAKELEPDSADATGLLGWIYYRKNVYNSALEFLLDAVSKQKVGFGPAAAFRQCYLGLSYLQLGDTAKAAAALRRSLEAGPDPKHAEIVRAALLKIGAAPVAQRKAVQ